jgi:hypothetical protein
MSFEWPWSSSYTCIVSTPMVLRTHIRTTLGHNVSGITGRYRHQASDETRGISCDKRLPECILYVVN